MEGLLGRAAIACIIAFRDVSVRCPASGQEGLGWFADVTALLAEARPYQVGRAVLDREDAVQISECVLDVHPGCVQIRLAVYIKTGS
jgi:hypothetical protein